MAKPTPPPVAAKKSKRTAAFKPKAPPKPPKPPKVKAPPKPRKPRKPRKPKKKAEPKKKAPETAFLTATVFPSAGVWTLPGQPGRMRLKSAVIQGFEKTNASSFDRGFALRILSGGSPFFSSFANGGSIGTNVPTEVSFGGGLSQASTVVNTGVATSTVYTQSGLPTDGVEVTENGGVQITCLNYAASDVTPPCVFGYTYTL
jgi:hypothetical protein